jgi:hypothetical protein
MVELEAIEKRKIDINWLPSWRVIPDRYPPINFFEKVAPADDWEALLEIEAMTDDHARFLKSKVDDLEPEDRIVGPGSGRIMPSFIYYDTPGRFNEGAKFGAYYAARELDTAIIETMYHRESFLRATKEKPQDVENIVISADVTGELHDCRGLKSDIPALYDPDDYSYSHQIAKHLREQGSLGIVYDSVRHSGGECAAVFRPRILANCEETKVLVYQWDGNRISGSYEKSHAAPRVTEA